MSDAKTNQGECPAPDPADCGDVAHSCNSCYQCREHQWRNDHFYEAQEYGREQGCYVANLSAVIWEYGIASVARRNAK